MHFADQFHWHIMAAVLVLAATVRADAAEPKRVMLLYSLGRDFNPWSEYATTIRRELTQQCSKSPWPIDITEHSIAAKRRVFAPLKPRRIGGRLTGAGVPPLPETVGNRGRRKAPNHPSPPGQPRERTGRATAPRASRPRTCRSATDQQKR